MRSFILYLSLVTSMLTGCKRAGSESAKNTGENLNELALKAERFQIEQHTNYYTLKVVNPWQRAKSASFTYLLGDDSSKIPDSLKSHPFIKIPVEKVILMSTTYISMIDSLAEMNSIVGLSGTDYVYSPSLNKKIKDGKVKDVGYNQGLNYERILELDPDVLFLYGVEAGITQTVKRMGDMGIPVIMCADYLEDEPLARAEWIKFFSVFYNKLELAERIFSRISQRYDSVRLLANETDAFPSVFVGLPWKDVWYVPGGNSFAARFIEDAGGNYIYKDLASNEAIAYDLEAVYSRIYNADIWLNAGIAGNLRAILEHDERFSEIKSFKEPRVYNNNRRLSESGGNDYWESGIINPDLILNDLRQIISNDIDSLFYYKSLR